MGLRPDGATAIELYGSSRPPRAWCRVVHPPDLAGRLLPVSGGLVLGRGVAGSGSAALPHPTVSRRHLRISWEPSWCHFTGEDLGSKNGSAVDGAPLATERRLLQNGAVIRIGDVVVVFETEAVGTGGSQGSGERASSS